MSPKPKIKTPPPFRTPNHVQDPESYDRKHLRLRLDLLDFEHGLWGWHRLSKEEFVVFLKFAQSIEKQTWAEIKTAAGGKRHGSNSHSLIIPGFSKEAQRRLRVLNLDRVVGDSLFSLRLSSVVRVYGARENEYFRPIWHDPYHGDPDKAAYPCS